jgi:glyoxylase-like metal-dependent hydrolase (beta-lactamase superfamily II)
MRYAFRLAVSAILLFCAPVMAYSDEVKRTITDLGDGIYRFTNKFHSSIFIVGKDGLLMTDPMNKEAAMWLRDEIRSRFGDLPVKYVVYSHNHDDHISGGQVFADPGTVFIAHDLAAMDMQRNMVDTHYPNVTFKDAATLNFEGRAIELQYHGPNNGYGNISLFVPDAKFLFVVDWIVLKRLPWMQMYYYDLDGSIASIQDVLNLDFDTVSPGHMGVGTKADVQDSLAYLELLRASVLEGMNEGLTLDEMKAKYTFDGFKDYFMYDKWREQNIEGAYNRLAQISGRFGQKK